VAGKGPTVGFLQNGESALEQVIGARRGSLLWSLFFSENLAQFYRVNAFNVLGSMTKSGVFARRWVVFDVLFLGGFAMMKRLWCEDEGILTFEWILLLTVLVIGVVGGVAGIRDAIIHECQGVVGAMESLNQTYYIAPPLTVSTYPMTAGSGQAPGNLTNNCTSTAYGSEFVDDGGNYGTNRLSVNPIPANNTYGQCPPSL